MKKEQFICTACGNIGEPEEVTKGGCGLELLLWLLAIVPGIIYSIWRSSTKNWVCPKCGNSIMIPVDSPNGKKLLEKQNKK